MDISVTVCYFVCLFVCLFVCTVTNFSAEDKAIGVKFCTAVHRRPRQGISYFGELCSPEAPQKPKIERIGRVARAMAAQREYARRAAMARAYAHEPCVG